MNDRSQRQIQVLLDSAGVNINGGQPWDIQVHDDRFYNRFLAHGSLGLGESYMDGWWDCDRLDEFFDRALSAGLEEKNVKTFNMIWQIVKARLLNMQSKTRSTQVAEEHYDLGNDLYEKMLDPRMQYSCAYWKNADDLDQAQINKLDLICKKIGLKAGQSVLDIGCGWGGFVKFAAEKYGARSVGITISKEQAEMARRSCAGLPVEIRLQDYRDLSDTFDHIVSIGMIEHVGYKNYRTLMMTAHRSLRDGGLFLLHTIGRNNSETHADPWLTKYIFPGGMLPSIRQLGGAVEGLFVMEDWHNFGSDYDKTLMSWHANFERNWDSLKSKYDERFRRMWNYYLLICAGAFRSRNQQLWQIVLSKNGVPGGYTSLR